ncbi:MAG TPA: DUF177 domain-containing protein [Alphaproteobacteria bacterium]|nr:DUF177 domain-containing protein [Alphaproteobacteria bacterium]
METKTPVTPEFSRMFAVVRLEEGEASETVTARESERQALAARFGLLALDSLGAELRLKRVGHGPVVRVEGRLVADVVQACVVSLEPVGSRIEEDFVLHYAPQARSEPHGHVIERGEDEATSGDWPEPLVDGRIDLGEAVAQQLAVTLDPYPRKPGVRLEDVLRGHAGVGVEERPASPFAALARLTGEKS